MAKMASLFVLIAFSLQSFDAVTAISRRPANIVGPTDDRGMVKTIGAKYLSPAEAAQIRNNVGYVFCPGNPAEKLSKGQEIPDNYLGPITTTGFLVSKNVIVTSAHTFANFFGTNRPNLAKCYFQPQGDGGRKKTQYHIVAETLRHGFRWQNKELNDDFAVVRLEAEVERAQPLLVLNDPAPLSTDTVVYPIVAFRPNGAHIYGDLPQEPLIQECKVTKLMVGSEIRPSLFNSNCDNERGGSGGPNLVRVQGRLVVTGIFSVSGPSALNFQPYSETAITANGVSGLSLSRSVNIDSGFLRAVDAVISTSRADLASPVIGSPVPGARPVSRPSTGTASFGN